MKKRKKLKGKELQKALAKIKTVIFDIDGVLTDGRIWWVEGTGWTAAYSVIDGFGIRQLKKSGIEVCFISGGNFISHKKRAEILQITHAYFGNEDKIGSYEKIKEDLGCSDAEVLYMGDELFDIPVLERAGFSACPPHAPKAVQDQTNWITKRQGGFGAAREICDLVLDARAAGAKKGT